MQIMRLHSTSPHLQCQRSVPCRLNPLSRASSPTKRERRLPSLPWNDIQTTRCCQLNTLSRSSSFTWNVTLCGAIGSSVMYRGSRSCRAVKPAALLKSRSLFSTFFPSSARPCPWLPPSDLRNRSQPSRAVSARHECYDFHDRYHHITERMRVNTLWPDKHRSNGIYLSG